MQRRIPYFLILPIAIAAAGVSWATAAGAAELGDARVSSHIGQQLVADIELTMLEDAHAPVQVRLADPEVYSGAGIALPPALSTLSLSVMRRDGRQFLHATTLRPVDADHLHLYLELLDHGQRVVRLATLWLTPDPRPAPASVSASVPAPVPAPVAAPAAAIAPAAAFAQAGGPAHVFTPAHARGTGAATPAAPSAPEVAPARRSRPSEAPAADAGPASARASEPAPVRAPHAPLALPLPLPAPAPLHSAVPAACAPQDGGAQSCAALGARNAELRTRIGHLEERVKGLQARLGVTPGVDGPKPAGAGATPAAAATVGHLAPTPIPAPAPHGPVKPDTTATPPAEAKREPKPEPKPEPQPEPKSEPKPEAKPAAPPGPKPISSIKPLVPHKPRTAPADDDLPLGAIGAGLALLALAGAGVALLKKARAKRARNVDIPGEPGLLDKLRRRLRKGAGAQPAPAARAEPADAAVVEPSLE
ncbi:hypothetical protein [Massilia sp. 9096]|uniref:FimV/HubP-related protein n=1 Tax=Massilia sp. 9096 TaxID=1500894 RepID=UPI000566B498|nr:hypothetical protein [Massilia sp. 9096]